MGTGDRISNVVLLAKVYSTFWVGCPDQTLQLVIDQKVGDVILVGTLVQIVVVSANRLPIAMSGLDN